MKKFSDLTEREVLAVAVAQSCQSINIVAQRPSWIVVNDWTQLN
jgi:hypothetical protein